MRPDFIGLARKMRFLALLTATGLIGIALAPQAAHAEPGASMQITGQVGATVAEPTNIQLVENLRFGRFFSPTVNSTIRIQPNGNIQPSAGIGASISLAQPPEGRGTAEFRIEQDGNRGFNVTLPTSITISNGTTTMVVDTFRDRQIRIVNAGRDSIYRLEVGATLRINANQAVGKYVGDFDVTVVYN